MQLQTLLRRATTHRISLHATDALGAFLPSESLVTKAFAAAALVQPRRRSLPLLCTAAATTWRAQSGALRMALQQGKMQTNSVAREEGTHPSALVMCTGCKRHFKAAVIARHGAVCTSNQRNPVIPFDSARQRRSLEQQIAFEFRSRNDFLLTAKKPKRRPAKHIDVDAAGGSRWEVQRAGFLAAVAAAKQRHVALRACDVNAVEAKANPKGAPSWRQQSADFRALLAARRIVSSS